MSRAAAPGRLAQCNPVSTALRCLATGLSGLPAGRWKGVVVAIKIVDHSAYVGTRVDALRESVLSTSVQHPNVVRVLAWMTCCSSALCLHVVGQFHRQACSGVRGG